MVEEIDTTRVPVYSRRSLIMVAVVVVVVTGSNLWLNRNVPPLGYVEFSNFGFTIAHPQDMYISTEAFIDDYPSKESGQIQGTSEGVGLEQFGVFWATEGLPTELESSLDFLFMVVEQNGEDLIQSRGPFETTTKDSHELVYQTFEVKDQIALHGIIGAWNCDGKVYMLYLVKLPDVSNPEIRPTDLESKWRTYLDSFKCH